MLATTLRELAGLRLTDQDGTQHVLENVEAFLRDILAMWQAGVRSVWALTPPERKPGLLARLFGGARREGTA